MNTTFVITGLDPVISKERVLRPTDRDGRVKPRHDTEGAMLMGSGLRFAAPE
jgi:hypothetical protein